MIKNPDPTDPNPYDIWERSEDGLTQTGLHLLNNAIRPTRKVADMCQDALQNFGMVQGILKTRRLSLKEYAREEIDRAIDEAIEQLELVKAGLNRLTQSGMDQ